jgi:hypothetical protein
MIPDDNDVDSEHKDYTKSSSYKLYSDPATAAANAAAVLVAAMPGAPAAPPNGIRSQVLVLGEPHR